MVLHVTLYSLILLIITLPCSAIAVIAWLQQPSPGARLFAVLMVFVVLFCLGSAIEFSSTDHADIVLASAVELSSVSVITVMWFFFVLDYTGRSGFLSKTASALICVIPVTGIVLQFTNEFHHLYITSFTLLTMNGGYGWEYSFGPTFWFFHLYSFALAFTGLVILLGEYISFPAYRKQLAAIIIACVLPILTGITDTIMSTPVAVVYFTPFALLLAGFLITASFSKFDFLSIMPITHSVLLENMSDGYITVNPQSVIVDLNTTAKRIIGLPEPEIIGKPVGSVIPDLVPFYETCKNSESRMNSEIQFSRGKNSRFFTIQCMPVVSGSKRKLGQMIILRNVSDLHRSNLALEQANQKLNLLSSIMRHDLLNQLHDPERLHRDPQRDGERSQTPGISPQTGCFDTPDPGGDRLYQGIPEPRE